MRAGRGPDTFGAMVRRWIDVGLGALFAVAGLAGALSHPGNAPRALVIALTVAYPSAIAVRRRYPLAAPLLALAAIMTIGLIDEQGGGQDLIPFAIALCGYTLGRHVAMPSSAAAAAAAVLAFVAALVAQGAPAGDLSGVTLLLGAPWAFGSALRTRAHASRRERRAAAERERLAVEEERHRIARELHDVVAHSISVVSVQTQAVRRRLRPDQQQEAEDLRAVEATIRQAMVEMRRLFGVLRAEGDDAPLAPQPGLAQLPQLIENARAAGLDIRYETGGAPGEVSPGMNLTAYRIVQEALTNIRKHAHAGRVEVNVVHRPDCLEVLVRDDGRGPRLNGHPPGHGLIGMRERVALYGGRLETGPDPDGGFRVHATLPRGEEAP